MEHRVASTTDLLDGQMIAVTAGDERVLLAKVDGRYCASAARCPHWGGSLPHGTLHKGRLVCPLHGGTFDVRSGDLLEPPSMDGLSSYDVRVEGTEIFVDLRDDVGGPRLMPMCGYEPDVDPRLFVIIGGGAAGALAAEALRQEGYRGRILMISAEDRWPYDRPKLSKDYVAGTVAAKWLPLRPPGFYGEHGIERLHARVASLDVPGRVTTLEDGTVLRPDAVLIASGSTAQGLPVPGGGLAGVFTLRSWDDAERLVSAAGKAGRAVVVGTGFTGMEVAAGLASRGIAVTVVGRDAAPFADSLGDSVGDLIRRCHESHGTRFVMGHGVGRFHGEGSLTAVELDDGTVLETGLAVVAVGARPATSFVRGVRLDADGGLPVDAYLQVAPGVWAAGDVARFPDAHSGREVRIEHWRVAEQHGRVAGRAMAGRPERFTGVPFFWTQQFEREIFYAGVGSGWDETHVDGKLDAWDFTVYYVRDGRLVAACSTRGRQIGAFMELTRSGRSPLVAELRRTKDLDLGELLAEG